VAAIDEKTKALTAQERMKRHRRFNILALDGGGTRGTIEAVVLERLDKEFPSLMRKTDLIAGTSTGGIQALGLAAGNTPTEVRETYVESLQRVFADTLLDDVKDLWKAIGADYSTDNMREVFAEQFGDKKLKDLEKKVAIPAFHLDPGPSRQFRSWKLKVFHNFEGPDSDGEELCVDVGLRTSAAPVFFPTVDGYCDGGVVANNPALIGLAQALRIDDDPPQINILSLGAGKSARRIEGDNLDWGAAQWAPHILYMMLEGGVNMIDFQCQQILGESYHRINPLLTEKMGLDDWTKVPDMMDVANEVDLAPSLEWLEEHWK
jgi:patatin-like phospholipase/acyl hydrolase